MRGRPFDRPACYAVRPGGQAHPAVARRADAWVP
ncbi:hypothetical protein B1M_38071 [Burkholderia sp. TJI49]|nr:hypothetical protein B1M_38071 [Burkholderia sp. TJI49]